MAEVYSFKAGDAVPPWLIDLEPSGPGHARPRFVFEVDVDVVDLGAKYWVLPKSEVKHVILRAESSHPFAWGSPDKQVFIALVWADLQPASPPSPDLLNQFLQARK